MATMQMSDKPETEPSFLQRLVPKNWVAHTVLIIAVLIIAFPMLYALLISTQNNAQVFNHQITPGGNFVQNMRTALVERNLGRYMLNSALIASIIAVGKTILSVMAGLGLVFFRYRGKWLVFGFILVTLIMPADLLVIALFRRVTEYRGILSDLAEWAAQYTAAAQYLEPHPYFWLTMPALASATGVFIFRQHFMTIPPDLSEAAQLDGASPLQFLFRVLVPLSWSTMGALFIIMFIFGWNEFLWPLIFLRDQELQVVQWGVQSLSAGPEAGDSFGPLMAGVVVVSIPPLVIFFLLQRQILNGFAITRK